jgi:AcrR family transcriptional regulator
VTSRVQPKVRRRSAPERRAEIVAAATRIALDEGLDEVTMRSVAEALDVVSGLVAHYFPTVDGLLAEVFRNAAGGELAEIVTEADRSGGPLEKLRVLMRLVTSEDRNPISLLWIDAWHAGRRRPDLRAEVAAQMTGWLTAVTALIDEGRAAGEFAAPEPRVSATRILAVIDGLSIQAVMRDTVDYRSVQDLAFTVAERELGLTLGILTVAQS